MAQPDPDLAPERVQSIRMALLAWYHREQRDLPWRNETDPYRIWVSEVMLQQTQVTTVIPYYKQFLARFPDVATLAAASLDEVLKVWQGLGYYARARNLHRAAGQIVAEHQQQLPQTYAALRKLPGFGDYTAGAVASIAFGQVAPAIDGNVKRVLARLFAIDSDITRGEGARRIKKIGAALVDAHQPGDWNQALMELGATVCLPQTPRCLLCPVHDDCRGLQQGLAQSLPIKPPKKKLPHYDVTAAVIHHQRKNLVLIAQRPLDGMLGGLWEFPGGKQEPGESLPECLQREIREELGIEIAVEAPLVTVKHSYTHFKITLHAFTCQLKAGKPQSLQVADWRWVSLEQLDEFAFPRTDQQIIAALRGSA